MGLLDTLNAKLAARRFNKSTLGQALAHHTRTYFYQTPSLAQFSQERKDAIVGDFYSKITAIAQSENPAMACRTQLAEYVILFSMLAVLCLREHEKADQFYSENPFVSGELWQHIEQAADNVDELKQLRWQHPNLTADELIGYANTRSALMLYYANGLNMVRIEMGDTIEGKDWFLPFVEAQMIVEEDRQREQLNMPRLVPGLLHSLPYSVFLNLVVDGANNPFFEWTQKFPEHYLAGEGPLPES